MSPVSSIRSETFCAIPRGLMDGFIKESLYLKSEIELIHRVRLIMYVYLFRT
jgi:hypothetical protein